MPQLAIVCAMSLNRIIGIGNQMPWHLPADFQFFKRTTLGKAIIMGRKTYDSIGKPLPGRTNIVVSRQRSFHAEGVLVADSLARAITIAEQYTAADGEYCVIGGGELYAQALPLAQRLYLTEVQAQIDGDAHFPEIQASDWQLICEQRLAADAANCFDMVFKVLEPAITR